MNEETGQGGLTGGWHVSIGGTTYGPYEWAHVVAWVREGRIGPDALLWQPGFAQWIPAQQIPGLFVEAPSPSAPGAGGPRSRRRLWGIVAGTATVVVAGAVVGILFGTGVLGHDTAKEETAKEETWVYADGSGDFPTLEEAVANDRSGSVIRLGSGTFTLTDSLSITRDLVLVGQGSDGATATTVSCAGTVVHVGDAMLIATGIDFVCTYSGPNPANVVEAEDAKVDLTECRFTGGNIGDTPDGDEYVAFKGNGLYFYGTTTGTVKGCVCTLNDHDGIAVDEEAEMTLEGNECTDNGSSTYGGCGISVSGSAICTLTGNTCDSNGSCGIEGNGEVEITAIDNLCRNNDASGIEVDFGGGEFTGNTCSGNRMVGMLIFNSFAKVTLQGNDCSANGEAGIDVFFCVSCVVRDNTCLRNGTNGIEVGEGNDATISVEENECSENAEAGIYFGQGSTGTAANNECARNTWGIHVDGSATPTLGKNNLHDNDTDLAQE